MTGQSGPFSNPGPGSACRLNVPTRARGEGETPALNWVVEGRFFYVGVVRCPASAAGSRLSVCAAGACDRLFVSVGLLGGRFSRPIVLVSDPLCPPDRRATAQTPRAPPHALLPPARLYTFCTRCKRLRRWPLPWRVNEVRRIVGTRQKGWRAVNSRSGDQTR